MPHSNPLSLSLSLYVRVCVSLIYSLNACAFSSSQCKRRASIIQVSRNTTKILYSNVWNEQNRHSKNESQMISKIKKIITWIEEFLDIYRGKSASVKKSAQRNIQRENDKNGTEHSECRTPNTRLCIFNHSAIQTMCIYSAGYDSATQATVC